eukprot:CAMPEP_0172461154 /NCGR_PEP_ID=MMETSP1065-20121228/39566_1 /TAXON_ID=265537 /ORGANISM="Amphiprora paludosa, Strain CCMP125" /LENGTH=541 /DNA_ID=CAMNT_0013216389 /DNA_START=199 /DNA_END=1824 /DNA_ORIENTATION=+
MGNAQCLAEPGKDVKEGNVFFVGPSRYSQIYDFENPDLQGDFLKLHLQERPDKCILEPKLVVQALVRQAEELVRRELEEDSPVEHELREPYDMTNHASKNSSVSSMASETISRADTGGVVSSVVMSMSSNVTSVSAATPVAGNFNRYASRRKTHALPQSPPKLLGNHVDLNDTLHRDLNRIIDAITKVEEKNRMNYSVTKPVYARIKAPGCLVIPQTSMDQNPQPMVSHEAKLHLITLHLRINPRCAKYFQSHLSRLLPHHPFSMAVSSGISSSDLSPSRRGRGLPRLVRTDSDSISSMSADIDFGEGPPSQPVQLLVDDSTFLDLGLTGSLGLVDRPRENIRVMGGRKFLKPPAHYIVLLNRRSGAPLAVCALKNTSGGDPVVRIYATKRRAYGQRPAASTRKLGFHWTESFPLYTWAEIVTEGRYPNPVKYSIFMASGNDGRFEEVPSYLAEHSSVGSSEIRILGMTDRETEYTGCAVLCLSKDYESNEEDLFFRLSVSKGVDPALFVCFAAFVDELMEKTMRMECSAATENMYRVSSV